MDHLGQATDSDVSPPLVREDDAAADVILRMHGITRDEIEPEGWVLYERRQRDALTLERLARVATVNKEMRAHGLPPLLLASPETGKPTLLARGLVPVPLRVLPPVTPEQRRLAQDMGLMQSEHDAVRGSHSKLIGLDINGETAKYMQGIWRTKEGRTLVANGDATVCRTFVLRQLKRKALCLQSTAEQLAEQDELVNAAAAEALVH